MSLTILISTLNEGVLGLKNLISINHPEIRYLIVHQNHNNISLPDFLKRDDIEVVDTKTKGLSKSRNIGLKRCTTDYALIADDDVEYVETGLMKILEIIRTIKPDFASFKIQTPDNEPPFRLYKTEKYSFDKGYISIASIELLLNIYSLKENNILFDERFGLGTRLRQGEEEILIHDMLQKKLNGYYFPYFIVKHPYESTGTRPIKESRKYFLKGAFAKRLNNKTEIPNYSSSIRNLKNSIFFNLGKCYISLTSKTK